MTAATERELIRCIAEDPSNDDLRQVLADFYVQNGDPRGELMSIQLAKHPLRRHRTRLARLLRDHRDQMVGTLADILVPTSLRFERGRLAACRTAFTSDDQRRAVRGNPLWATVTELETDDPDLVADDMMRSLRTVHLPLGGFALLCRHAPPLQLEVAWLRWSPELGTLDDRRAIGHATNVPQLRLLGLRASSPTSVTASQLHWLMASPLGQRLDELAIHCSRGLRCDEASFAEFRSSWPRPLRFDLRSDHRNESW